MRVNPRLLSRFSALEMRSPLDCCIVLLALWSMPLIQVAYSIVGAVALNLVLAINHRPGRYMGQ